MTEWEIINLFQCLQVFLATFQSVLFPESFTNHIPYTNSEELNWEMFKLYEQ